MADPSDTAVRLQARAKGRANAGDFAEAERILHQALPMAHTSDSVALVVGTLAFVEAELGHIESGLQRCKEALALPDLSTESRQVLLGQHGYLHWLSGDTPAALQMFDEAVARLRGESRSQVLLNRGAARMELAELDRAQADFEEGARLGDAVTAAKCTHNLGYLHMLRGELVDALRLMDDARPLLMELGPASAATNDVDRAEALAHAGLLREATGILRRTRSDLAETSLWRYQADVDLRLADLVGGPDGIDFAEAAAARFRAHHNDVEADRATAVAMHLRAHGAPRPRPEDLLDVARRLHGAGRRDGALALRVRAAGLEGAWPEAVPSTAPLSTRLLAGEVGAGVALDAGDPAEALRRAGSAVGELEEWQSTIGSLELQTATRSLGVKVLRLGQRAALTSGDPSSLLEWSERARELVARGVPVRPPEELGDLLAQLRHLGPEGDADERARLIEQIRHGRWHAPGSVQPATTTTLDQLRTALGERHFVSVLQIDDEVIALSVGGDEVAVHRLGPWDLLARQLGGLGADLAVAAQSALPVVRAGLRERLAALDAVLAPAWTGADHVVLTVPEELARVPWGQLPSLRGVAVTLPTSATAWVRATAHAPGELRTAALVIGPGTGTGTDEAAAVRRAWAPAVGVAVHDQATCSETAELAGSTDLLHISAHGRDRDAHPLLASVRLADGPWFGHDVELLPDVPAVVILSACGVGGGSLGMARAWLHAGAHRVIAAPTDISEQAAADRFPVLHRLLADGVAPERAVAEAFGPDALDCAVQCYGPA